MVNQKNRVGFGITDFFKNITGAGFWTSLLFAGGLSWVVSYLIYSLVL